MTKYKENHRHKDLIGQIFKNLLKLLHEKQYLKKIKIQIYHNSIIYFSLINKKKKFQFS